MSNPIQSFSESNAQNGLITLSQFGEKGHEELCLLKDKTGSIYLSTTDTKQALSSEERENIANIVYQIFNENQNDSTVLTFISLNRFDHLFIKKMINGRNLKKKFF